MKFLFHAGVSLFSGVIVGKCLPQFADGIRQMGFQSLDGDVEDGGHFFIFEFVFADEFESHFTFGGKRVDSLVQAADTFPADKFFFGSRFGRGEKVDGDFVLRLFQIAKKVSETISSASAGVETYIPVNRISEPK